MHTPAIRVAAIAGVVLVAGAFAHPWPRGAEPTFAEDVAPIVYKSCAACHHPGGNAPFSVLDYDSVVTHVDEIRDAVKTGYMPPWHADGPHDVFRNDRRLSDAEKDIILTWIDGGAKRGDDAHLPPKPSFSSDWTIGTPDAVVSMTEDFTVPASGTVEYQYFQVPTNFTEDKWVQAIEIKPGAREVVHHVLVFARVPAPATPPAASAPTASATQAGAPARAPLPPVLIRPPEQLVSAHETPRSDPRNAPPKNTGVLIGTEVPGTNVIEFPRGAALRLRPGTVLTFQMHYTAHGHEMKDRTSIGFRFAPEPPAEEIFASHFYNQSLEIPAGAKNVAVPAEVGFGRGVKVWGLMPHTHLRGTRWHYVVQMPDGSTSTILDVPHYDFNWQTYYMFTKPIEIPAGGKIVSTAWYDNSAENKHNPDPTKVVWWGDQTWEEMQYTGILYSLQKP